MLNPADDTLAARLPEGVLRPLTPAYLEEPRRRYQGRAGLVAAPRNVDEVAAVVRACADARVGIPMENGVESLNAAVAASVLMYEMKRPCGTAAEV